MHLYTGAIMRNLSVEQYHMVYPEQNGSVLTQARGLISSKFHAITQEEEQNTPLNAHHCSCLVSTYTILFTLITLHMSGHCSKITNKCIHHSRPCYERLEIGIKPIALYTRHKLWLPTTEVQDTP